MCCLSPVHWKMPEVIHWCVSLNILVEYISKRGRECVPEVCAWQNSWHSSWSRGEEAGKVQLKNGPVDEGGDGDYSLCQLFLLLPEQLVTDWCLFLTLAGYSHVCHKKPGWADSLFHWSVSQNSSIGSSWPETRGVGHWPSQSSFTVRLILLGCCAMYN